MKNIRHQLMTKKAIYWCAISLLCSRVVDPDPEPYPDRDWIRIQEGKNDTNRKKVNIFHCLKCWMLSFEG